MIQWRAFIGSSYIRQYAEDWTLERMLEHTRNALAFAQKHNLPVMYVTEDTSRAHPDTIRALYTAALAPFLRDLAALEAERPAPKAALSTFIALLYRAYDDKGLFLGVATASDCDAKGATLTALRLMTPSTLMPENP